MGWGKRAMGWGKRGSEDDTCDRLQQAAMYYTYKAVEVSKKKLFILFKYKLRKFCIFLLIKKRIVSFI